MKIPTQRYESPPPESFMTSDMTLAATFLCYEIPMLGYCIKTTHGKKKTPLQFPRLIFLFDEHAERAAVVADLYNQFLAGKAGVEPRALIANYRHLRAIAETTRAVAENG